MPYLTRILSQSQRTIPATTLGEAITPFDAKLDGDIDSNLWTALEVVNSKSEPVVRVLKSGVAPGESGQDEIDEFLAEITSCSPASASSWLQEYLRKVQTIYAFEIYAETTNDWEILNAVRDRIFGMVGGIIQADGEGFTNEDGYHILWQFSDKVSGEWWMAVLHGGKWKKFKMDLADEAHRQAFRAGEVPPGVDIIN
ncbi:hypothetical protein NOJ05_24600 [Neorhizobium galegae]|uniref:hypothetical protein n=1 Tax=Neorhizobium galegae TaxID=399 RepID=UPI002107EC38|nr:hypothetical protein [Neorhizobium galegae]MCQ1780406.1 hypothetical protein [Neorhizobium galegae]MCQ1799122.1 hypothetical protein [Neorhizobium galegae]